MRKRSTINNLYYVCHGVWRYDKVVFLFVIVVTMLTAALPFIDLFFPKWILEELLGEQSPRQLALLLLAFFSSAALTRGLLLWLKGASFPHMIKVRLRFVSQFHERCMTTDFQNTEDPDFLDDKETAFRSVQNHDSGIEGVLHTMLGLGGSVIVLLGYITIICQLHVFILLYLVVNVVIVYALSLWAKNYIHSRQDDISKQDRRLWYLTTVMYDFSYGKELRLFSLQDWLHSLYCQHAKQRLDIDKQIQRHHLAVGFVDILLLLLREGVVYAYLIYLVLNNQLDIPNFTMFFATIASFAGQINHLTNEVAKIRGLCLEITDFRDFLDKEDRLAATTPLPLPEPPYTVEFQNVSFRYPHTDVDILRNVSLTIAPGQRLGIVGHNGAGKTTFIKLLCRLYDVTEGAILLNGRNIKEFDLTDYYRMISVVFQEIYILAFSAAENVTLQDPADIDDNRLEDALKKVGLYEKLEALPHTTQTSMMKIIDPEGIELSGGEKQKLAMARAIYKNGGIMVLDEPTAALDALAEYRVYSTFNDIVNDRPAIFISHRLASTHFCDVIAMFENGQIIEYGTHEELLSYQGRYADMFQLQSKYYREGGETIEA